MLVRIADLCVLRHRMLPAQLNVMSALQLQQCPLNAAYAHRAANAVYDKHIAVSSLWLLFTCELLT